MTHIRFPLIPPSGDDYTSDPSSYSFFFFSSRRRHTRFDCDWSSDVCSSDLLAQFLETSGGSLRIAYEEDREKASEQLDFERAAALHKKVEKLDEVLRGQPEIDRKSVV